MINLISVIKKNQGEFLFLTSHILRFRKRFHAKLRITKSFPGRLPESGAWSVTALFSFITLLWSFARQ